MKKKWILPRKEMKWKRVQVQQKIKYQTRMKRKKPEYRSSNQKFLTCQAKHCPGIKQIFFWAA